MGSLKLPWGLLFIAPVILGLLVFTYGPTMGSFWLSLNEWDLLGTMRWVAAGNYQSVLSDPLFMKALGNTVMLMLVSGIAEIVIGGGIAIVMARYKLQRFIGVYFLPVVTPLIAVSLVWGWLVDPSSGLVNQWLAQWGLLDWLNDGEPVAWLFHPATALGVLILLNVWKNLGYAMVLLFVGLQRISNDVYEASALDGASTWQQTWRITLPLLMPVAFVVLLMTMINGLQAFDSVYLLTQGGPQQSTQVLMHWMYQQAFQFFQVGSASAIAYVVFALIVSLTAIQWASRKRFGTD
jgi:multiple sugar transport system permease protein